MADGNNNGNNGNNGGNANGNTNGNNGGVSIDYERIATIIEGKQKATEDSVLKGYFKQQGLSAEEMTQAIADFKTAKAAKAPNVDELNAKVEAANARALAAEIELKATTIAAELGVAAGKVSYLLKMADTDKAVKDGKVDKAKLKDVLEAVLKDVPELKGQSQQNNQQQGGFKIGADNSNGDNTDRDAQQAQLARIFGVKL